MKIIEKIHAYEIFVKNGKIESTEAQQIKTELDNIGYEIPEVDLELWKFLAEQNNG